MVLVFQLLPWVLIVIGLVIETAVIVTSFNVPISATIRTYHVVQEEEKRIALIKTMVMNEDGPCDVSVTEEEYGPPRTVTRHVEYATFRTVDFQEYVEDKRVLLELFHEIVCSPVDDDKVVHEMELHVPGARRNVKRVWQYRGRVRGSLKFVSNVISTAASILFVPVDLISVLPLPMTTVITQLVDGVLDFASETVMIIVTLMVGIKSQLFL